MELDYAAINYLRNFLPYNTFFDSLLPQYDEIFENLGRILMANIEKFYIEDVEYTHELIDFLDGNGFEITRHCSLRKGYVECCPIHLPPEPFITITTTTMYASASEDVYYESVDETTHTVNIANHDLIDYDKNEPEIIFYFKIKTNTRSPP